MPLVGAKTAVEWVNEGNYLVQAGKYEEAIQAYDEALKINPQNANVWNNKGTALRNLGKDDEAIKAYGEALKIDPQFAIAWDNKGNALGILGRYDEANKAFNEALKINPQYADAWYGKGNNYFYSGDYNKAIEMFDRAIAIDPDFENAKKGKSNAMNEIAKVMTTPLLINLQGNSWVWASGVVLFIIIGITTLADKIKNKQLILLSNEGFFLVIIRSFIGIYGRTIFYIGSLLILFDAFYYSYLTGSYDILFFEIVLFPLTILIYPLIFGLWWLLGITLIGYWASTIIGGMEPVE